MYLPSRLQEDTGLHSDTSRRVGLQIEGLIANANVNAKINASNGESMEVNFWKKSWSETQNNTSVLAFFLCIWHKIRDTRRCTITLFYAKMQIRLCIVAKLWICYLLQRVDGRVIILFLTRSADILSAIYERVTRGLLKKPLVRQIRK